jgi:hypothetical protein
MVSAEATRELAREALAGERELKFALPASRAGIARGWLDRVSRRDAKYPAAIVWTIYYDTPQLTSLREKINSDYLKQKIRVRWYSDLEGTASGPAFVEAKLRVGNRRLKARVKLGVPAADIAQWDLQDRRLLAFPLLLEAHGISARDLWQPLMLIRYRRDRFVDRSSGSRVSLDAEIAPVAVNPRYVSAVAHGPLPSAVLEVKGSSDELPVALRGLLQLGIRERSFSKLLAVYTHMTGQML